MHKQNQQQMIGKTDKIFVIFFGVSRNDGPLKTIDCRNQCLHVSVVY